MALTKIFRSGNSQAVRIPREFHIDAGELEILKRGDEIVLRKPARNMRRAFELLTSLSGDFFADGRKQPPFDRRKGL